MTFDLGALRAARLGRSWYSRGALAVARDLIGCLVVREDAGDDDDGASSGAVRVARIVETEAYCGPEDLACHARAGLTKRTRSLLGEEGHAYVFFVYGMHDCFNVTCAGAGRGHAVLVRAGEPVAGFDDGARLDGPGRFSRAMGLTRAIDGHDLTLPPVTISDVRPRRRRRPLVEVTARVGVAYAGAWADKPWRFYDSASAHVSRPPKRTIGRP